MPLHWLFMAWLGMALLLPTTASATPEGGEKTGVPAEVAAATEQRQLPETAKEPAPQAPQEAVGPAEGATVQSARTTLPEARPPVPPTVQTEASGSPGFWWWLALAILAAVQALTLLWLGLTRRRPAPAASAVAPAQISLPPSQQLPPQASQFLREVMAGLAQADPQAAPLSPEEQDLVSQAQGNLQRLLDSLRELDHLLPPASQFLARKQERVEAPLRTLSAVMGGAAKATASPAAVLLTMLHHHHGDSSRQETLELARRGDQFYLRQELRTLGEFLDADLASIPERALPVNQSFARAAETCGMEVILPQPGEAYDTTLMEVVEVTDAAKVPRGRVARVLSRGLRDRQSQAVLTRARVALVR